jgi:hypothetical protein
MKPIRVPGDHDIDHAQTHRLEKPLIPRTAAPSIS